MVYRTKHMQNNANLPHNHFELEFAIMKTILLIGATGAIGQAVHRNLSARHTVITAGRSSGQHRVDMASESSVKALFAQVGPLDAIVSCAGNLHFGPVEGMSTEQFNLGLQDKLLGQVRLALLGHSALKDKGSITLTAGILSQEPIVGGANASAVNAAIEAFAKASAVEWSRGLRINVVSPTMLTESVPVYGPFFPGAETVSADRAALAYQRSVEGARTGHTFFVQ
jgi:NAD(P)-dependent dehydrogenase (short-subunit alcohol dehydrogenase family)